MTRRPNPIAGLLWMLLSCALLSGVAALARYAALAGVPPMQIVFLRLLFAFITMLPLLAIRGPAILETKQLGVYVVRVILSLFGMTTWFAALVYISIGEMTAITFLSPLLATVGAAVFLSESVTLKRWLATLAGLCGALIILRPGMLDVGIGAWLALLSAGFAAISSLFIKRLTNADDPDKVVFLTTTMQTPLALLPAIAVWTWPATDVWLVLIAMGVVATFGHMTMTRAFASADASLVMGADFARLPFAVLYGFILFGELIDFWTWFGAGVIFLASVYGARQARAAQVAAQAAKADKPR